MVVHGSRPTANGWGHQARSWSWQAASPLSQGLGPGAPILGGVVVGKGGSQTPPKPKRGVGSPPRIIEKCALGAKKKWLSIDWQVVSFQHRTHALNRLRHDDTFVELM